MTRKQKHIVIILGVLDLVVVGAFATIVVRTMTATRTAPSIIQAQVSPCVQRMLDTCNALPAPFSETATVAWDTTQLYITLHAAYSTATPPSDSAQLLWTALDEIAVVLQSGCYTPETITIALTAHGNEETMQYLAQLTGRDVTAWMAGTLSEESLAAQSHFRQTAQVRQD